MSVYHILAYLAIAYYMVLYSINMLHLALGYKAAVRWKKMGYLEEAHRLSRSMIVPPLTLVADLASTGEDAVDWVDHILSQRFPQIEVLLLFHDEDDKQARRLIRSYYLRRVDRVYRRVLEAPRPLEIYQSDDHKITLARAEGSAESESLNLALNLARYPLFAVADNGPRLEDDSLLCLVRPFMEGEKRVPAVVGVELPLDMEEEDLLPPRRITRFALMESLRVQLGYMLGAPYLGGPVMAYSSLVLYRKKKLIAAGGFKPGLDIMGAEMNMTLRLHRLMYEQRSAYRFVFLPQSIAHRPFPITWRQHLQEYRERRRGMSRALRSESDMLFRPRYGRFGLVQLPSFWLFVSLASAVGFAAYTLTIAFFILGLVGWPVLAAFLASSMLYPAMVGVGAVIAARRELGILRGQGGVLYAYAFLTQLWFRQLTALAPLFSSRSDGEIEVEGEAVPQQE
jgi:cellulose synthase/poly-beta-1,6-N-acetylglucosamine synthase-like glycosyltransferase